VLGAFSLAQNGEAFFILANKSRRNLVYFQSPSASERTPSEQPNLPAPSACDATFGYGAGFIGKKWDSSRNFRPPQTGKKDSESQLLTINKKVPRHRLIGYQ
jgi:hypothetical protein